MAGIYDVSLTVSDGTTSNTETKSAYITVKDVIADFSASTTSVYIGNTIAFTDASTCGPAMWQWTFTGGTPSSFTGQTPPPIEYATLGTYEVSLTVTKPGATDTKISSIQVTPALFNMSNQSVTSCSGQFFDSGGESGTYSSAQNLTKTFYPSTPGAMIRLTFTSFNTESGYDYLYVYNGPNVNAPLIGTYEGTNSPGIVSANNTSGALTFRFISDGSVVAAGWAATLSCYTIVEPPVTDFAASSITLPVNSSIGFIDLSVNAPTSWNWAFSPDNAVFIDGTTANSQNPHVAFTAQGIYTVSLTATNANGSDTETKADYITVGPNAYNMADGSITTCEGVFYDSGGLSGNYNYEENVTETFYASTPGAMLMFAFTSFETENFTDTLFIYDGSDITAPLIGAYNGSVGPGTVAASNPAGSLTFRFVALGGGGGPAGMGSGWVANISCYDPAALPVADFTASATTVQQNSPITFYDQSLNMPNAWAWSFNPADVMYINGTDEHSQNPQVQFSSTGQYTVSLTATNINGSNTVTKTNFITITQPDYCIPTYTYGSTDGDYITLVQLEDIDNWTGASENPYYTYYNTLSTNLMAGSEYTITLIAGTFEDSNIISVWIDYNQNGIFESLEKLGTVELLASPVIGNITFTVPIDANVGMTRMRVREVFDEADLDPCIEYGYGETEDYNINITNTARYLSLTLFLEGLFDGTSMNKAQNGVGDQFTGTIADEITVELRNHLAPFELAAVPYTVGVNTDGTASVNIPEALNGNYYIVVQHRNSIETWSGSPVSFSGAAILYDFTTDASQAYGDNMKLISGKYVIFSGDINLDGAVDGLDMIPLDNEAANFGSGYLPEDINGDSSIDALDMIILDNNSAQFISKITP
jgi:PKD repeat protein